MKSKLQILLAAFSILSSMNASYADQNPVTAWSPYQLVEQSPYVMIGKVEYVPDVDIAGYRVLKVMPREVLHGTLESVKKDIFIISPGPADGLKNEPPAFFPAEYLLFLKPIQNTLWNTVSEKVKSLSSTPDSVFEVVDFWQGAVSMNESYTERSNKVIAAQFGIENPAEISQAIKDIYDALSNEKSSNDPATLFSKNAGNKIVAAFKQDFLRKPFALSQ
jgi:hypothetical protein